MVAIADRIFRDSFDELHDQASAETDLTDFGETYYHEGMRELLESLDRDVPHTEVTVGMARSQILAVLTQRLITEQGWKHNPSYIAGTIKSPIIIIGLPRTGTTALHSLLAQDGRFQGIEAWLTGSPMVRPPRDEWASNASYQNFVSHSKNIKSQLPELAAIHDTGPDDFEESVLISPQNFITNYFCCLGTTGYDAWWWGRSQRKCYVRFANILRLIGLHDSRQWLLKCPNHIFDMGALLAEFPDACVIHTHRDPAKAIPSLCGYLDVVKQTMFEPQHRNRGLLGAVESVKWLHGLARYQPVREGHESNFCDVMHSDFLEDPLGEVKKIYRYFDMPLTEKSESRMKQWLAGQPDAQKGGHHYKAEDFGLTENGLRELYSSYIHHYGISQ